MKNYIKILAVLFIFLSCDRTKHKEIVITREDLLNRIKGGLTGQLLGNMNGLPYEETYNNDPGTLSGYKPALVPGAFTDDDTDIEWAFIYYMEKESDLFLNDSILKHIHINHFKQGLYSGKFLARELMVMGVPPSITGNIYVNPWASFGMAGSVHAECFGQMAPGMCNIASQLALNYCSLYVDQEPLQTSQLVAAMVAQAFITDNLDEILRSGINAIDPKSKTYEAVMDAITWFKKYPDNWKATRREIRQKYFFTHAAGEYGNYNKMIANTSAIIALYLYGQGDLVKTFEMSFNWGMDADCNAATIGTILGTIKGYKWFEDQGWDIRDVYCNKAREGLPLDETITRFSERILNLTERVILQHKGHKLDDNGKVSYHIVPQKSKNILKITSNESIFEDLSNQYKDRLNDFFAVGNTDTSQLAYNTYMLYVLQFSEEIKDRNREKWQKGVEAIKKHNDLLWILNKLPANYLVKTLSTHGVKFIEPLPIVTGKYEFKLDGYKDAHKVYLTGTMNDWKYWKNPMQRTENGWLCRVNFIPGKHLYMYRVLDFDGKTKSIFDPKAEKAFNECDGTENSVKILMP